MGLQSSSTKRAATQRAARASRFIFALAFASLFATAAASAQWDEEETSISLNAMMKLQAGMFVPLFSDKFAPHENSAEYRPNQYPPYDPCDPIVTPRKDCFPTDHGKKPGSASIARATLQIEAHWDLTSKLALHGILRAVRSAALDADYYGRSPNLQDPTATQSNGFNPALHDLRGEYSKNYVAKNYYNEVDLREFYMDYFAADWLSFRVGRQQVAWGETGSFRLLDVVNPSNNTWHFGALESFEDQRVPLWMLLTNVEIPAMHSSLELLYIPGVDRARDTVNAPLSFSGAWGIPYSNSPATFQARHLDFQYPGGKPLAAANMRGGARLKGVLGENGGYSLVYMANHMMNPVITRTEQALDQNGNPSTTDMESATLKYPRTHIVGGSFEVTIPSPVASTIRFEGAVDLKHQFSANTGRKSTFVDGGLSFPTLTKQVYSYALVFQRPTMIRWLNPTQNVLLVAQFRHTYVPTSSKDDEFVQLIGFNTWKIQKNSYTAILHAKTSYGHGKFEPRITGAYVYNPYVAEKKGRNSGFYTVDLGFRLGPHYRVNLTVTEFFGGNAYRDLGLFRDRDEVNTSFTLLF